MDLQEKYYRNFEKGNPPAYIRAAIFLYRYTSKTRQQGGIANDETNAKSEEVIWERDRVRTLEHKALRALREQSDSVNDYV